MIKSSLYKSFLLHVKKLCATRFFSFLKIDHVYFIIQNFLQAATFQPKSQ